MEGFVKLHRKLKEWEWYTDVPTKVLFMHLVLSAHFKDTRYRGVEIKAGSFITGRLKLSVETGLSEQEIRTALKKLQSTNEITIKSFSGYSVIQLINWYKYQIDKIDNEGFQQASNKQVTNEQKIDNKPSTNIQEYKERKEGNNKPKEVNKFKSEIRSFLSQLKDDIEPVSKDLEQTLVDFNEVRHQKKNPMTLRSFKGIISKSREYGGGSDFGTIQVLEASIIGGWSGVFPPKNPISPDQALITEYKQGFSAFKRKYGLDETIRVSDLITLEG